MRTTVRLLVKTLRFEIFTMAAAVVMLGIAAFSVTWQLNAVGISHDCLYSNSPFGQPSDPGLDAACQAARTAFYDLVNNAGQVSAFAVLVPSVAGLLIGVPLVARELETGTASLAWTLSRSRLRWYLRRVVPLALIVGLALLVPAVATVVMAGASRPDVSPWASFDEGSLRGPVVIVRGLLAMGIGVLAGALLGRQLPAVIAGGLVAILVMSAVPMGVQRYAETLAEWRPGDGLASGDQSLAVGFRDRSSGAYVDYSAVYGSAPILPDGSPDESWVADHFEPAMQVVPGWRYPQVTAVESAAMGGIALVVLALGGLVVDRRRPS
jgi:hypothetical protein